MTPAQVSQAALLLDNVREIESFLAKHDAAGGQDVYVTAARSRSDDNTMGLRLKADQIIPIFHIMATQLRVELEDMGVE